MEILNYGGGRQTVALCLLVIQGHMPRPDRLVIADTGRENPSTWAYLADVLHPRLAAAGLTVEIAPRSLAYVDLYGHNGDLLMPVYTKTGKLKAFCSTEWKARVVARYLRASGVSTADQINWIGFALDEARRVKSHAGRRYPLIEANLSKADCRAVITDAGLPMPPSSACWMCPNKSNTEWRMIRDTYPDAWAQACALDTELREEDLFKGNSGVWLHHTRVPLDEARIDDDDGRDHAVDGQQCGLGLCFV